MIEKKKCITPPYVLSMSSQYALHTAVLTPEHMCPKLSTSEYPVTYHRHPNSIRASCIHRIRVHSRSLKDANSSSGRSASILEHNFPAWRLMLAIFSVESAANALISLMWACVQDKSYAADLVNIGLD